MQGLREPRRFSAGRRWLSVLSTLWMLACLSGCNEGAETDSRIVTTPTLRVFQKPFQGTFPNSAPFDHDLPLVFQDRGNNYFDCLCGLT